MCIYSFILRTTLQFDERHQCVCGVLLIVYIYNKYTYLTGQWSIEMVFIFIEELNLWNFIRFSHSTSNITDFANSWNCEKKFVPFVSCDFEIGIHFGDVEWKWNGIKHAKVILIFKRNYANIAYVMLLYAISASHSCYYYYCTPLNTQTWHDAMP